MLILNDIHNGFERSGGTTLASREAMRSWLYDMQRELLDSTTEHDLLIVGDLFDAFEVDTRDFLATLFLLSDWMNEHGSLYLLAGNHDWSPKGEKISSFEAMVAILKQMHGTKLTVATIDTYIGVDESAVALAHCSNQTVFNEKLEELLGLMKQGQYLFLHANYDNKFAAQSDHSLNVSEEMAKRFVEAGIKLVFAHEHQARKALDSNVIIMGNQWPTSVADCLGNEAKFAHVYREGAGIGRLETPTWSRDSDVGFVEVDWRLLDEPLPRPGMFIRVTGIANADEASAAMNAVAKLRSVSEAFVITNAIKVEGVADAQDLPEAFEATKRFDVLDYIRKHLEPNEMAVVEELLKGSE